MINLVEELNKAYNDDAWHGNNTLSLILSANPQKVFTHPIPNAHSIAELVLHLTAWTEEALDRINGQAAKEPLIGDWPMPKDKSAEEWQTIINQFKKANEQLIGAIANINANKWNNPITDYRDNALGTGVNNAQLISGIIQHHAYHSGQIALLLKF